LDLEPTISLEFWMYKPQFTIYNPQTTIYCL
jgi:hypothetical protein